MSLYTMKLSDSVDTMEFNLLEVPIQDKDIEGAVDNVVLSGDIYTDFLWLKKRFTHKWSILCKDDYERLRGFYTRQFSNAEVPIYQLLDAPSPIEESAGSGEYIQITTTDSTAKLASVEMLGNATQSGTPTPDSPVPISVVTGENVVKIEGKNLFDKDMTPVGAWHATKETTQSGIELTSTASGGVCYVYYEFPFRHSESVDATMSFQKTGTGFVNIYFRDKNTNVTKSTSNQTSTFSLSGIPSTTTKVQIYFYGDTSASGKVTTYDNIQLELGNSASQFEPYQAQEFEINLGKNLLDPDSISQGTWINASLTNTCTFFMPIFTGETFTISNQDTSTYRFSCGLCATPHAGTNTQDSGWQTGTSYTITAQSNGYLYVQLRKNDASTITPSTTPTNVYMVEHGSQATSFAPYFTPIELAKIGTYQDRIYKEDSKWYIEKQVGKVVLDGSESWSGLEVLTNTTGAFTLYSGILQGAPCLSNYFVERQDYTEDAVGIVCRPYNTSLISLRFSPSTLSAQTIAGIKTWLSTHNTIVYYALATPTTTEITNEALIAQLDALGASSLYLGVNNIGTETLNAVPTLALTYFPYYPHEIISPKAVRMELTDGGIINACECRENVQITLRETIQ